MDEHSRPVKQSFNHSVPLNGMLVSYMCQELEKEELLWTCKPLGLENHHDFCPKIAALKSLGGFYHNPALWWWLGRGCAMVAAVSASLHYLVMTLAHILHSVRGMLPSSSSSLPLRNSEEMRSDTWKCYSAVTSPGRKMVLEWRQKIQLPEVLLLHPAGVLLSAKLLPDSIALLFTWLY